jgi:hypothetical protein
VNESIYSLLLCLYPAELRADFGPEMTQVFLDDMEDGRRRRGLLGAAQVWWRSVKELCQIVLSTPRVMVTVFIYLSQTFYFYGVMRPHRGLPVLLIPLLTTFIALEARDYEVPDPSPLSRRA